MNCLFRIPCGYGSISHLSFNTRQAADRQAPGIISLLGTSNMHAVTFLSQYDGSSENQREYHEGDKRVEASSKGQTPKTWTISNQGDKYEEPSPTVYHRYTSSPAASGARMPCSHALHSPARTSYFERPHGQDAPTPRLWEWETTGSP
ncbi:uncharacterized protein LOC121834010 isoform X2 [Ixodes scapularis]|uniref:uncharacterized protein LOC121834010 isoform X2 n=1 Tax=Ixodes scapularis TaxID=6945 RepID=UPI001C390AB6|nr:uncharacterized protein LOC121834010 isoform X2 [Ixodes scapularis]